MWAKDSIRYGGSSSLIGALVFLTNVLTSQPALASGADDAHFANTRDVQVQELLSTDSLAAMRAGHLSRFNLMQTNSAVRDSIREQRNQVQATDSPLRPKIESYSDFDRRQRKALEEIRQGVVEAGRAIFYPFGGADPQTPLILDGSAEDVFLQTADEFGGAKDLAKLSTLHEHDRAGGFWGNFDSFRDLHLMQAENNIKGTGFQTVARIQRHLDAEVVGVYPMSLTESGQIHFEANPSDDSVAKHALVVIKDKVTGKTRRVWQFQHNITSQDERFLLFMKRVKFGTMLIKAAPSMMFTGDEKVAAFKVLEPAKANNAAIISDVRISDSGSGMLGDIPQPVFRQVYTPRKLTISGTFGYSSRLVYLAKGEDLISPKGAEQGEIPFGANKSAAAKALVQAVDSPTVRGVGFVKSCSELFGRLFRNRK